MTYMFIYLHLQEIRGKTQIQNLDTKPRQKGIHVSLNSFICKATLQYQWFEYGSSFKKDHNFTDTDLYV